MRRCVHCGVEVLDESTNWNLRCYCAECEEVITEALSKVPKKFGYQCTSVMEIGEEHVARMIDYIRCSMMWVQPLKNPNLTETILKDNTVKYSFKMDLQSEKFILTVYKNGNDYTCTLSKYKWVDYSKYVDVQSKPTIMDSELSRTFNTYIESQESFKRAFNINGTTK